MPDSSGPDPAALRGALDEMAVSTDRLLATVDGLDDAALRQPSRLPGWTRAHVLTHIARNADGLVNLVTWARTGEETPMYAGGRPVGRPTSRPGSTGTSATSGWISATPPSGCSARSPTSPTTD